MIGSSRSYAIGMAHFQITGGFKMMLAVCGAYLFLVGAGLAALYYGDAFSSSGMNTAIVTFFLIFEAVVLLVLGSFRVASAIRLDVSSRMIESHRMMPVPGWRAVMGYLFGGNTHAIIFALLNVLLAAIFAGVGRLSLEQLAINQALLFSFALLLWTFVAFGTFLFIHMYYVTMAVLLVGGCVIPWAYLGLPGFAILVSPMIGNSVFSFSGPSPASPWAYAASLGTQAVFIAILFIGCCRRYRGTYPSTFTLPQSLSLVAAWSIASFLGITLWSQFSFGPAFRGGGPAMWHSVQATASIIAGMVLALVPVATTLAPRRPRIWLHVAGVVFLIAAFLSLIPLGMPIAVNPTSPSYGSYDAGPISVQPYQLIGTFFALAAHALTLYAALRLLRRFKPVAKWIIITMGLLAYWLGPLVLEAILAIGTPPAQRTFGIMGTLSPMGLILSLWNQEKPSPLAGIVLQWLVALFLLAGCGFQSRLLRTPTAPPPHDDNLLIPPTPAAQPVTAD